ncbi:hypothetical protein EC973_006650 [Apophysomyces ossiformis]|uniref:RRM domain-containing protein n=1 Tax=Apophysomyces ossiformis TaxID=679940 RepID=A0A8H7ERJ3_9FUNG|nr:hypothetical protein EC973_006650 [Apophysomyces ossiformis]
MLRACLGPLCEIQSLILAHKHFVPPAVSAIPRSRSPSPPRRRLSSYSRSRSASYSSRSRSRSPRPGRTSHRGRSPSPALRNVVLVENLTRHVSAAHIKEIFSQFGTIRDVDLPTKPAVNLHGGKAYVEYDSKEAADNAILHMDGLQRRIVDVVARLLDVVKEEILILDPEDVIPDQDHRLDAAEENVVHTHAAVHQQHVATEDDFPTRAADHRTIPEVEAEATTVFRVAGACRPFTVAVADPSINSNQIKSYLVTVTMYVMDSYFYVC